MSGQIVTPHLRRGAEAPFCQGIAHYIRWIPFDSFGSALRRGFAAALRCVTRVMEFFPGTCPGKNHIK